MLGDFLTRVLVMLLGYIYPAFECFKTVEKNRAEIDELRFWCQYWILVAALTVFEKIGEVFISWLPLYSEAKVAFFIYLWYPKTKGTSYVYDNFLRPYVAKHETVIDQKLQELKARAWDIALLYWKDFASQGQMKFFELLQYLAKQSSRSTASHTSVHQQQQQTKPQQTTVRKQQPPTPAPVMIKREISETPKTADQVVQMPLPDEKIGTVEVGNVPEKPVIPKDQTQETEVEETLSAARARLRRSTNRS